MKFKTLTDFLEVSLWKEFQRRNSSFDYKVSDSKFFKNSTRLSVKNLQKRLSDSEAPFSAELKGDVIHVTKTPLRGVGKTFRNHPIKEGYKPTVKVSDSELAFLECVRNISKLPSQSLEDVYEWLPSDFQMTSFDKNTLDKATSIINEGEVIPSNIVAESDCFSVYYDVD